jgi:hypothetical protein
MTYSGTAKFPSSNSINYFRLKTGTSLDRIRSIAVRLKLPGSSIEMNEDQTVVMVVEILISWAVMVKWVSRDIANTLISELVEKVETDLELWDGLNSAIESSLNWQ